MAIDEIMLGAVRHHLMGTISVVRLLHMEMAYTGRSLNFSYGLDDPTFGETITGQKKEFLQRCQGMLIDPVPTDYAHIEAYHLKPTDRDFLDGLLQKAEKSDWTKPEQVEELISAIDAHAPYGGFKGAL